MPEAPATNEIPFPDRPSKNPGAPRQRCRATKFFAEDQDGQDALRAYFMPRGPVREVEQPLRQVFIAA